MHIEVEHKALKEMLELVARVSTKHITLPVLQCVLLEVVQSELTIKATNLEIGIEGVVAVTVKEEGAVAVPAATFLSIVNLLSQRTVTLKREDDVLVVESGGSKSKIHTVLHSEFPAIPKIQEQGQKINRSVFAFGIKSTAFAASQSSIKPELGSIYVHQKKEHTLTMVATDSFRLMEKTTPQNGVMLTDKTHLQNVMIPSKNALEIARVCEVLTEDPEFIVSDNQCALRFKDVYITSRLTSGSFPDYEQIIPKEYTSTVTLLTKDLLEALKKTNIFLNKFMQLTVEIGEKSLTLSAAAGEIGTTTTEINASVDGDSLTLNFNQRYLMEALQYIVDDSVVLKFAGIGRPLVLENVHDSSMRYLVMPMNK